MILSADQFAEYKKGVGLDARLECLECGKSYKMLGNHLLAKHGMSSESYRDKYGLPNTFALWSPDVIQDMSEKKLIQLANRPDLVRAAREACFLGRSMQPSRRGSQRKLKPCTVEAIVARNRTEKMKEAARRVNLKKFSVSGVCSKCKAVYSRVSVGTRVLVMMKDFCAPCRLAKKFKVKDFGSRGTKRAFPPLQKSCPVCRQVFTLSKRQMKRLRATGGGERIYVCSRACQFKTNHSRRVKIQESSR